MNKPEMPAENPVVLLEGGLKMKLICDAERFSSGSQVMRLADMLGTLSDEEGNEIGKIGMAFGGNFFIDIESRTWIIDPVDLFGLVRQADGTWCENNPVVEAIQKG